MKKFARFLSLFVMFSIVFSTVSVNAARLEVLYQQVEQTVIAKGVTQTKYRMLSTAGWIDAVVVEADMSQPHLSFRPIFSDNGTSNLVTTQTLAAQNGAVAAINADFFAWNSSQSGKGSSVGTLIVDGELVSSPDQGGSMASLYENEDGTFQVAYPAFELNLVAPNGEKCKIDSVNKYDPLYGIAIIDRRFVKTTGGSGNNVVEALVSDGVLVELRDGLPGYDIGDDEYVMRFTKDHNTFIIDNFQVGDEVTFELEMFPDLDQIQDAVGGGTQLVKDGKAAPITHQVSGANPRSAAGVDKTGKILYLIAVDGRGESRGISLEALTEFMISIGVYNGINFDGGGSTAISTRPLGQTSPTIANKPSENRAVSNAAAIFSEPVGTPYGLQVKPSQEYVFAGTSCSVSSVVYDENYNTVSIDESDVEYAVSGVDGQFDGNVFRPAAAGTATITAEYKGITGSVQMTVLNVPDELSVNTSRVNLEGFTPLTITGTDKDGYTAPISVDDLDWTIEGDFAQIAYGGIQKKFDGEGILTLSSGGAKFYIAVSTSGNSDKIRLPYDITVPDYKIKDAVNENTFTVYGDPVEPNTLLENLVQKKAFSGMSRYRTHYFLGSGIDPSLVSDAGGTNIVTGAYNATEDANSLFVTMDNSKGGFFSTDKQQWNYLTAKLQSTDKSNVFIFLPKDAYNGGFTDAKERTAFFDLLEDEVIAKGKNCFVFANGSTTAVKRINGIRYITTGGTEGATVAGFLKDRTRTKYVTVTVDGADVSYQFVSAYN